MRTVVLAVAFLLLAFSAPRAEGQQVDPARVDMMWFQFVPQVTVVQAGAAITWRNVEPLGLQHNVLVQAFVPPSGLPVVQTQLVCGALAPTGETCSRDDLPRGLYAYTCTIDELHTALMHGVLVVQ